MAITDNHVSSSSLLQLNKTIVNDCACIVYYSPSGGLNSGWWQENEWVVLSVFQDRGGTSPWKVRESPVQADRYTVRGTQFCLEHVDKLNPRMLKSRKDFRGIVHSTKTAQTACLDLGHMPANDKCDRVSYPVAPPPSLHHFWRAVRHLPACCSCGTVLKARHRGHWWFASVSRLVAVWASWTTSHG